MASSAVEIGGKILVLMDGELKTVDIPPNTTKWTLVGNQIEFIQAGYRGSRVNPPSGPTTITHSLV